jgi:sulfur-oxidizing protein SoxX
MLGKLVISFSLALLITTQQPAMATEDSDLDPIEAGRAIAFNTSKGNCLGCHAIPNDPSAISPGNLGPKLQNIKARYADRSQLRWKIYDASSTKPKTAMPPFGKNQILTSEELDLVVEYIYSI